MVNSYSLLEILNSLINFQNEKESHEEIERAFRLFAVDNNEVITFENLKEIAKELGETMSDDELKLMIYEANKSEKYFVNIYYLEMELSLKNNLKKS